MSFLQNLWSDLVDKKLLPVVAVLIAGLIAVPVVLGRAKDPETPPPAEKLAQGDNVTSPGRVTLDPDGPLPEFVQRESNRRDPFGREKVAVKAADATKVGVDLGKKLGGGSDGPTDNGPKTPGKVNAPSVFRVTLEFGQTGSPKRYTNIERLTALPSADNQLFTYEGIDEDKKSVIFSISTEAVPSGDGICEPAGDNCQKLTMNVDDLEYFDVPSGTGGMTQYELRILAINSGKYVTKK